MAKPKDEIIPTVRDVILALEQEDPKKLVYNSKNPIRKDRDNTITIRDVLLNAKTVAKIRKIDKKTLLYVVDSI